MKNGTDAVVGGVVGIPIGVYDLDTDGFGALTGVGMGQAGSLTTDANDNISAMSPELRARCWCL